VFDLISDGRKLGRVKLSLSGTHNVSNALAVAALGRRAGLDDADICKGLEGFTGVGRRMSYKGEVAGVVVVDDYAHHPTEIRVTLDAIRSKYQPKRLFCVFQPHQHSRTRFFLSEFSLSFGKADVVLLPEIYFVRDSETMRAEIHAGRLAERIVAEGGRAEYLGDFEKILEYLHGEVRAGDVVVTMGAGDVWKLADELICRLGTDSQGK
jgi:UDP-N-acetylmuramate--alanine ligase